MLCCCVYLCCVSVLVRKQATAHSTGTPDTPKNSNRSKLLIPATTKFDSNSTNYFQKKAEIVRIYFRGHGTRQQRRIHVSWLKKQRAWWALWRHPLRSLDSRINWVKGKSAGMLRLRRKGAVTVMDELRDKDGSVWLPTPGESKLEIVRSFTHLGSKYSVLGNRIVEVKARAAQASVAAAKVSRPIFNSSELGSPHKFRCMDAPVLTRAMYHTQLWPRTDCRDTANISPVHHRVLREFLRKRYTDDDRMTDLEIRQGTIGTMIGTRRLANLGRLVRAGPNALYGLLQVTKTITLHEGQKLVCLEPLSSWVHQT